MRKWMLLRLQRKALTFKYKRLRFERELDIIFWKRAVYNQNSMYSLLTRTQGMFACFERQLSIVNI